MEDDAGVKELVAFIFAKHVTNTHSSEIIVRNSSILTQEFLELTQHVVHMRKHVIFCTWQNCIENSLDTMLSSHEMYLRNAMWGCLSECDRGQNIFDCIINACAFVKLWSDETLKKTGVDFSDLNSDILMVLYNIDFKRYFSKSGGFHQFDEYIRSHPYLTWNFHRNAVAPDDLAAPVKFIELYFAEKLVNEVQRDLYKKPFSNEDRGKWEACVILVRELLSTTSAKLPTLPSNPDRIIRPIASRENETPKSIEGDGNIDADQKLGALHEGSSSSSNSFTKQKENIARYENIIQAVIRHNHSKSSAHVKLEGRIMMEARQILEPLKFKVKSLIEVLDEDNKD